MKVNEIIKIEYNKLDIFNKNKNNNIGNNLIYFYNLIKNKKHLIIIYKNYNIKIIKNILNFINTIKTINYDIIILKHDKINKNNLAYPKNASQYNYVFFENKELFSNIIDTIININCNIKKNMYFLL